MYIHSFHKRKQGTCKDSCCPPGKTAEKIYIFMEMFSTFFDFFCLYFVKSIETELVVSQSVHKSLSVPNVYFKEI